MKRFKFLIIIVLAGTLIIPIIQSCKKGAGDPFFSIYSRKQRMAGDWKITKYTEEYKSANLTINTTIAGNKKTKKYTLVLPDTTLKFDTTFTGIITYNFNKKGNFEMNSTFTNDSTSTNTIIVKRGMWYFTGGGSGSSTKYKELLALQKTEYTVNPSYASSYQETLTGDQDLEILHINTLKNKEIILKVDKEETTNVNDNYKLTSEITLEPK